ncbi:MAG: hypothetical protein U9Q74_16845 [Gemmatimonadota bacterium]|nr:hypothetical protein [Gemmatimonadota bacterium]
MALTTFSLNGVPLENYNLTVKDPAEGWLTIPKRNFRTVPLVMRDGVKILSPASTSDPRMLRLNYEFRPSSFQDRRDKLNNLFRSLYGRQEIISVEDATKLCYGYLVSGEPNFATSGLAIPYLRGNLGLLCPDPLWYDVTPQSVAINAVNTPTTLPMGYASARMRRILLRLNGSWSSPITAILKNAAGDELQRMTIAVSATGSEYVDIDCDAFTITKYSGGSGTDQLNALTSTHDFLAIDPQDNPTLEIDKGTAVVYYYRAYVA